jgi:hypothetical protein
MTDQEREIITAFIARVSGAGAGGSGQYAQPLPAVDKDAAALIEQLFAQYPEAPYRITQLAFVQEHALAEAQSRIAQLQAAVEQAKQAAAPPAAPSPWGQPQQAARGMLGGLFGGGSQPAAPAAPAPQYAPQPQQYQPQQYAPPGYQPGMFQPQQQGTGFLGSALRTAAGVAGGVVAGNALMSLFSGGREMGGFGGGGFGAGGFGQAPGTVINETNIYEAPGAQAASSPWPDTPVPPIPPDRTADAGFDPNLRDASWDDPAAGSDPGFDTSDSGGFDDNTA